MPTYKSPGVYTEEIPLLPPSVAEVSTAMPAFIGYTEKAIKGEESLTNKPTLINTLLEYQELFGGAPKATDINVVVAQNIVKEIVIKVSEPKIRFLLYHSLDMYFKNGGGSCYIVSVGDYKNDSPKDKDIEKGLNALKKEDEPTLIVLSDAVTLEIDEYIALYQATLAQCDDLKDRFAIFDIKDNPAGPTESIQDFRNSIGAKDLNYGAAYFPNLMTSLKYNYDDTGVKIKTNLPIPEDDLNVLLQELSKIIEELLKGVTDDDLKMLTEANSLTNNESSKGSETKPSKDPKIESSKDPEAKPSKDPKPEINLAQLKEKHTGFYNKIKAEINKKRIVLPPSGAIAGIYANVDKNRGVWKAPANISLSSVIAPTVKINQNDQEKLNVDSTGGISINAIRAFTGKGILIWGARTMAGNDNEWRYISVRRLFIMIEKSVQKSTAFAVFEGNDIMTWLKVKVMVEGYLEDLWRQGALAGPSPEKAFFVNIGLGKSMTDKDILEGRMIVEIGVAAVRPAEFIILKFSHKMQEAA